MDMNTSRMRAKTMTISRRKPNRWDVCSKTAFRSASIEDIPLRTPRLSTPTADRLLFKEEQEDKHCGFYATEDLFLHNKEDSLFVVNVQLVAHSSPNQDDS